MGFMQSLVLCHDCIVRDWICGVRLVDDRPEDLGNSMFDIGVHNWYKIVLWSGWR
jgi:hypothetical protein